MSRIFLALLLLASLWPTMAAAKPRAAQAPEWEPSIERLGPGLPAGVLPALGGWEILPRPDAGRVDRDSRNRLLGDTGELPAPGGEGGPAIAGLHRLGSALLEVGALLLRYEHLPYFATAPPASR